MLQRTSVNYNRPSTLLTVNTLPDTSKKKDLVSFNSEQYQPEIHSTTDGITLLLLASPLYRQPFYTIGKTVVTAAIFKNGVATGKTSAYTVDYHKAIGKKIIFNILWNDSCAAQKEATLSNDIEGSLTYGDKQWLGYLKDFDITLDMVLFKPSIAYPSVSCSNRGLAFFCQRM